eukprot:m.173366 g.173366  ORF g.173366 m.173366 type:complete len:200 (-) comp14585_c0_seq2:380-979(-)
MKWNKRAVAFFVFTFLLILDVVQRAVINVLGSQWTLIVGDGVLLFFAVFGITSLCTLNQCSLVSFAIVAILGIIWNGLIIAYYLVDNTLPASLLSLGQTNSLQENFWVKQGVSLGVQLIEVLQAAIQAFLCLLATTFAWSINCFLFQEVVDFDNLNSFEMFDHVDKAGSMKRKPTALDQRTERRSNYMDGPPQVQTAAF